LAKILSFDMSLSNSGWALTKTVKRNLVLLDYGTIGTKRYAQRSTGMRLDYIYGELEKIYKDHKVDIVVKERSFSNSRFTATQQIMKVNGIWEMVSHLSDHDDFTELPPSTVKKWATGDGKASKQDVINTINEYFGLELKKADNDIADAIAVSLAYCRKEGLLDE